MDDNPYFGDFNASLRKNGEILMQTSIIQDVPENKFFTGNFVRASLFFGNKKTIKTVFFKKMIGALNMSGGDKYYHLGPKFYQVLCKKNVFQPIYICK